MIDSRGARARRGGGALGCESAIDISIANGMPRENTGQLLVCFQTISYNSFAPFHATFIIKAERAVLETRRAPSRQMEAQMTTCNNSSKYSTDSQNWEYPSSLKLYSFSPVNGGAQ
jgi:hypothetical protein